MAKLQKYCDLLREWNAKINLVSRKDTDRLEIKHLAHCLTITKFLRLMPQARLLDVGTVVDCPASLSRFAIHRQDLPNGFNWEKSNGSRGHGQTTRSY